MTPPTWFWTRIRICLPLELFIVASMIPCVRRSGANLGRLSLTSEFWVESVNRPVLYRRINLILHVYGGDCILWVVGFGEWDATGRLLVLGTVHAFQRVLDLYDNGGCVVGVFFTIHMQYYVAKNRENSAR